MTNALSNLPGPVKGILTLGVTGGFLWGVDTLLGVRGLAIVLAGLLLVGLTLLVYLYVLKRRRKRRAERLGSGIRQGLSATPHGVTQAESVARMDDLRNRFEQGLKTFKAAGKDLYALPWFVLVGEPGGGKTEAIRKSNVGFPPGLHDELQGAGGTINMNWWFTNSAVILDTAGRLMFEDVDTAKSSEWKEFLNLLLDVRPHCPINGMMLVISAESLIRDSAEDIEKKGAKIARQFDTIQRTLDIRFPATVLITKCDLINGFREYFEDMRDPHLQHQMLGWSNPEPIDRPFQPDLVSQYMESVRKRLLDFRLLRLNRAGSPRENAPRPFDASDALYDFPHSFARILPRLKRYLQIVFAAGEWSSKPLFLRGIYFTSSMREGNALDADLAEALGVPVESLPEGRVWEKDRAYFLRDVWKEKVFKEKGLVTRATNTIRLLRRRKLMLLGAGFCSIALLFLLTWLGGGNFRQNVGLERDYWAAASSRGWQPDASGAESWVPLVYPGLDGRHVYGGATPIAIGGSSLRVADFHAQLLDRVRRPLHVPLIFRVSDQMASIVRDEGSLRAQRNSAQHVLFESGVLRPLLNATRQAMSLETAGTWSDDAKAALEQLIRLEAHAASPGRVRDASPAPSDTLPLIDLNALFRYVLGDGSEGYREYRERDRDGLDRVLGHVYKKHEERFETLSAGGRLADNKPIHTGLTAFAQHALRLEKIANLQQQVQRMRDMAGIMAAVRAGSKKNAFATERRFVARFTAHLDAISGYRQYQEGVQAWNTDVAGLRQCFQQFREETQGLTTMREAIPLLNPSSEEDSYEQTLARAMAEAEHALAFLRLPETQETIAGRVGRSIGQEAEATLVDEVEAELGKAADELRAWQETQRHVAQEFKSAATAYAAIQSVWQTLEQRSRIYDAGHTHLNEADSLPEQADLAAALAKLKESTRQRQLSIHRHLATDDPLAPTAATLARKACALAEQGRAHRMTDAVLQALPAHADALAKRIAANAASLPALREPQIPLASAHETPFDTQYHPAAAKQAFEAWQAVADLISRPETAWLNPADLKQGIEASRLVYRQYAERFMGYWTIRLAQNLTIRSMTWDAWRAALKPLNADAIHRGLEAFGGMTKQVGAVEAQIEHLLPENKKRLLRSGLDEGLHRLENKTFQNACQRMLSHWNRLPPTTLAARDAVLALAPAEFSARYLAMPGENADDYVARYWDDLGHALLRALSAQAQSDARNALRNVKNYMKFPLNRYRESAPDLSAKEVMAAAANFGRLRPGAGTAGGTTLGDGAKIGIRLLDDTLRSLNDLGLPDATGTWLGQVDKVLGGLPSEPGQRVSCRIVLPGEADQRRLFKENQGDIHQDGIFSIWRVLALKQGDELLPRTRTLHHDNQTLGTAPCPGDSIEVSFYRYPGDHAPDWSVSFAGPWAPLRILHAGKAERDSKDAKKWNVQIHTPVREGERRRSLWIQLEFDHVFPTLKDWPTFDDSP